MSIDYNNPETWCSQEIYNPPDDVDRDGYQAELNRIAGVAPNGKPNIELTWMGEGKAFTRYYSEWDAAGFGTKTQLRAKYAYSTYDDGNLVIDIPGARWVLEQRTDAAQYAVTDEQVRWKKMQIGHANIVREARPPRSLDGYYSHYLTIAKHNRICCAEAKKRNLKCWGEYEAPNERHLELLRRAIKLRDEERNAQSPYEPLSNETLKQAAIEAAAIERAVADKTDAHLDDFIEENAGELIEFFTGIKKEIAPMSIPSGYAKSDGGLIVPN
jgi:hypothetical protein